MPLTADSDDLRRKLTHAEAVIAELRGVVAELRKQIEAQQAHIHRLVKITFGRGGERVEGPTFFDGMAVPEAEIPTLVETRPLEVPPATKRKGHGRRCKPKDLPRRSEVIDLSEAEKVCGCCGTLKVRIGQSVSERLDYQPMAIFVRELVRPTYACRSCEQQGHDPQIAKAALPPEPIPKSGIGSGLLAHVIVSKVVDHLPLNRQESILARHGWDVCRSTLCDHLQKCGVMLTPLYDLMHRRLLQSFAIHADDTPLLLLRPRRTAYAWLYLGDAQNPYTLFDFTAGRSENFPQAFLAGYRGFVHADAYDGYNAVHSNLRHLGCWMHARRYFVEAEPSDSRAVEALAFIRTLYAVESPRRARATRGPSRHGRRERSSSRDLDKTPITRSLNTRLPSIFHARIQTSSFTGRARITRDQLLAISREVLGETWAIASSHEKKSWLVDQLDRALADPENSGRTPDQIGKLKWWLPEGMSFEIPEPKPAKAKKARKAG